MQATSYVLEVVVFTVKDKNKSDIEQIRLDIHQELSSFRGFQSLECFAPLGENGLFADIIKWDSIKHAKIAAKAFERGDFRVLPYLDAIDTVQFMGYFKPSLMHHSQQEVA